MNSCNLGKKTSFYYDIEKMKIGRVPTKSNLKRSGSDNSIYLGIASNDEINNIICSMFRCESIDEFSNKSYSMNGYGINIAVTTNINAQGQVQIKINNNGLMCDLFEAYLLEEMDDISPSEVMIVIDFKNYKVRFKKISDLEL